MSNNFSNGDFFQSEITMYAIRYNIIYQNILFQHQIIVSNLHICKMNQVEIPKTSLLKLKSNYIDS